MTNKSILTIQSNQDGTLEACCDVDFFDDPSKTGIVLAIVGRAILECTRCHQNEPEINRERREAQLVNAFQWDMEQGDDKLPSVKKM